MLKPLTLNKIRETYRETFRSAGIDLKEYEVTVASDLLMEYNKYIQKAYDNMSDMFDALVYASTGHGGYPSLPVAPTVPITPASKIYWQGTLLTTQQDFVDFLSRNFGAYNISYNPISGDLSFKMVDSKTLSSDELNELVTNAINSHLPLGTSAHFNTIIYYSGESNFDYTIMGTAMAGNHNFNFELPKGFKVDTSNLPPVPLTCTHQNKHIVHLGGLSKPYWYCPDCKADLGDA